MKNAVDKVTLLQNL